MTPDDPCYFPSKKNIERSLTVLDSNLFSLQYGHGGYVSEYELGKNVSRDDSTLVTPLQQQFQKYTIPQELAHMLAVTHKLLYS